MLSEVKPDALLILGDTNSALSAIAAKIEQRLFVWGTRSHNFRLRGKLVLIGSPKALVEKFSETFHDRRVSRVLRIASNSHVCLKS
ncbi:hypothetical protein J2T13_004096 [Paenibacillus sp. DS2015]